MRKILAIVLLLPLAGCFADRESQWIPSDIAPMFGGGGGGGGSAPAPVRPAPGYNGQPLAPGTSKMLEDPEARTELWEDPTFADSQAEAERSCEEKAAAMTRSGGSLVRSVGARQVKGKLFQCQLVSEVSNDR